MDLDPEDYEALGWGGEQILFETAVWATIRKETDNKRVLENYHRNKKVQQKYLKTEAGKASRARIDRTKNDRLYYQRHAEERKAYQRAYQKRMSSNEEFKAAARARAKKYYYLKKAKRGT